MLPLFLQYPNGTYMTELDILFPEGKEIILAGQTFKIKPFTFGQMPKVIKVLQLAGNQVEQLKLAGKAATPAVALSVIAQCGEELIKLMAEILKVDTNFISDLSQEEAVELMKGFYEVNSDFFSKRVMPLITKTA